VLFRSIGTRILRATINGKEAAFREEKGMQSVQPIVEVPLAGELRCEIAFAPAPELIPPEPVTRTGESNQGLKIVSTQWRDGILRLAVEGLAGRTYRLRLRNAGLVNSVEGAARDGDALIIQFPAGAPGEFLRKEITVTRN
jgi:hypothetical protein